MYQVFQPRSLVLPFFLLIFLFLSCNLTTTYAQTLLPGQWTTTTLGTDVKVRALLVSGTKLYAGTNSGVWQTTDSGVTWTQTNTGLTTLDVRALALSGTTLYAGTNGGGIFRTTDGTTWTAANTGITNGVINALAVIGTDLFAGTNGGGVFYSMTGTAWTARNTGISSSGQIYSLLVNGNDLYAAGVVVINESRHIYRSTDKGATWTATGGTDASLKLSPPALVYSMAVNGATLLAATFNGLYRSTNNGMNWQLLEGLPLSVLSVLFSPTDSAVYAAGTEPDGTPFGVCVSTDNGTTWRASSFGLPGANPLALIGTTLFAGQSSLGGVYTSSSQPINNASVAAADFRLVKAHAPEAIASIFGPALSTIQAAAATIPLPTMLGGTTVKVLDSLKVERPAPLFYVSRNQINYQVPAGTASGWAYVTIKNGDGISSYATAKIAATAFGLFTMDSTGTGVPSAYVQRVRANGSQSFEAIGRFDPTQQKFVTIPIDLGPETDQVFLVLFGTGFRGWDTVANPVTAYFNVNSAYLPVDAAYAGAQPNFVGVDQVNLLLPRGLAAAGEITLYLTANGGTFSNIVKINVK